MYKNVTNFEYEVRQSIKINIGGLFSELFVDCCFILYYGTVQCLSAAGQASGQPGADLTYRT